MKEKTWPPPCFLFVILRNLHLYSRMLRCDRLLSRYLPQRLDQKPSVVGTAALPATMGTRQTGELVYLGCIVPVWEHASCCLVWAWKWRAYGTPFSALQYSKRSYIIHLFSPHFFGELSSKCHWQTLLIWQVCEAAVQNLDGLASQLLVGRVDIGMIMRYSFEKNEWINNQSSVWEE